MHLIRVSMIEVNIWHKNSFQISIGFELYNLKHHILINKSDIEPKFDLFPTGYKYAL